MDDEWGGLALIENDVQEPFADGDPDEIIPEDDLPFTRVKITPTIEEEETPDAIRTLQAWVVDIPDPRKITTMLKWLKQSGFDSDLGHLKRIRRHGDTSTLLICTSATTPILPTDLGLAELYTVPIPSTAALTITSAKLKSAIWPTVYAPRRKGEIEPMTRGRVKWACDAMRYIASQAMSASAKGELPIVAHVPIPYDNPAYFPVPFTAHDTRNSTAHPLRHAVLNVIRSIADHRSSASESECPSEDNLLPASSSQNGSNYLLTSLSLFTTHEPCIMCSMALLHSRVKEVYFLVPKEKTGGCGSLACLPRLDGVNHRYGIWQWHDGRGDMRLYTDRLVISDSIDA
ncbi:hypothetical protein PLICRDRAFT_114055 [Plicaturopsis crispa FD-325 SS-3]|nr:hypothetical protein PLICRDRAFT_114055 [Plicaturopsis crispa FD-325 SS-3]